MPILATYGQFSTYIDAQGKYRVIWQEADGNIILHKFPAFIPDAEVEAAMNDIILERDYGEYTKLPFNSDSDEAVIVAAITHIRTHPALTLPQWNQYLNALTWYNKDLVQAFIFRLAQGLAEHYGINLGAMTELQVLAAVRDWICTVNINILRRVIFGHFINI